MSEEDKKKPFFESYLYTIKIIAGFLSVMIGLLIANFFFLFLLLGIALVFFDESGNGFNNWLEYLNTWKIDVGLAILLGSTIISGGILLSFIRKV